MAWRLPCAVKEALRVGVPAGMFGVIDEEER
jgi:hypothetical protein